MPTETPRLTYDCIIVGAGPAGLSAALMLGRCRRNVLVCDMSEPRNARSKGIHAFLTRDGISPGELVDLARREIQRYPTVEFRQVEILDATRSPDGFRVVGTDGRQLSCRKLLLATGVVDELPDIEGLLSLYGTSIHHCPYCDGWEWRDHPVAIWGRGEQGLTLALGLTVWTNDLVLCTDGPSGLSPEDLEQLGREGIEVQEERIARLEGNDGKLERIVFQNGESLPRQALFLGVNQHQRSELARKLGCRFTSKGAVDTGTCEATDVPGLYVAGDASKEAQFVIVAAAEGAEAGMAINKALLKDDLAQKRNSTPSRTTRGGPYAKSG
ncbi:MAG TPA: NAD(P)/FAD-dependent oxidoreductase [Gemmatimonadales bacterium]|jgi:thioredoxin reductase|nr:NAD(P)/FAD-dependent oxidoreductase [Gemmatimonadales bacterium]